MELHEGQQFGGYHILRMLAQGGMATVYLAEDLRGRQVSLEVLQKQTEQENMLFLRNAHRLANLNHPHIVRIFDVDDKDDTPYIATEYLPRGTLRSRYRDGTRVPLEMVVSYVKQVADALQYAHNEGIIHGDVKPDNMFVAQNGDILLGDFGIAKLFEAEPASIAGTPAYMAPEVFRGRPSFASDQYSLAIVAYEWLCGTPPFSGDITRLMYQHIIAPPAPLRSKNPSIPPTVERVIFRALAKRPEDRFSSVQEFARALQVASAERRLGAAPSSIVVPPPSQWQQQEPTIAIPPLPLSPTTPSPLPTTPALPPSYGTPSPTIPALPPPQQQPYLPASPPVRSAPGILRGLGDLLDELFSGRGRRGGKQQEPQSTQLKLFAIARTQLESDDRAFVGKIYVVEAGISQNRPEGFTGGLFLTNVQDPTAPILFDIVVHADKNSKFLYGWHQRLRYIPTNAEPQLVRFPFRVTAEGKAALTINFYRELQWLHTVQLEFEGIDQSQLAKTIYGREL